MAHPVAESLPVVDQPWRLGVAPRPEELPAAPSAGEHSIEVMREAGFTPAEIDELIEQGALWADLTTTS